MRIPGLVLAAALLAPLAALPAPATAQNALDQFEVSFQAREAQRRATIASAMAFTEEEAEIFWPIYDQYRLSAKSHQLRRLRLIQHYSQNTVGMDAETATQIMDKALTLDNDQHTAKAKFFTDLAPHFQGARYFRLFQLETKLKAIFRAGWTQEIPLAVTEEERAMLQMGMEGEKQKAAFQRPTT